MRRQLAPRSEAKLRDLYPIGDRLPGWGFRVRERSAGAYVAEGSDLFGHLVSNSGVDPERTLDRCVAAAREIQLDRRESSGQRGATVTSIAEHLGMEFERGLREAVGDCMALGSSELERVWTRLEGSVGAWLDEQAPHTSILNQRPYVLQKLCELFPEQRLYQEARIAEVVLGSCGLAEVGDEGPDGTILSRLLSPRLGVVFRMRGSDGKIVEHEFFD